MEKQMGRYLFEDESLFIIGRYSHNCGCSKPYNKYHKLKHCRNGWHSICSDCHSKHQRRRHWHRGSHKLPPLCEGCEK